MTNSDINIKDKREALYPKVYIPIGSKALWFYPEDWFERGNTYLAFTRIMDNLYESLDPNYFFFANHPRENIGIKEFEKFPYILLPMFIYGLFVIAKKETAKKYFLFYAIACVLTSLFGYRNKLGIFILYPFISTAVFFGLLKSLSFFNKKQLKHKNIIYLTIICVYLIVQLQVIAYAQY